MRFRNLLTGMAAFAMVAAPTMAAAANPAASLSVAPASARASAHKGDSKLAAGGGIFAVLALGAIIVGAIVIGTSGDSNNGPAAHSRCRNI